MDYQGLPAVDLFIPAEPDAAVPRCSMTSLGKAQAEEAARRAPASDEATSPRRTARWRSADMADVLRHAVGDRATTLTHVSLSWHGAILAVPPSARLCRLRRRRRRRRRPGHLGRRGARAQGLRPAADRGLRRRRLHDGQHGALDRGALPHSAAVRGRQQPLVLQRRGASGARRRACATVRSTTSGSASASPIPTSTSRPWSRAQGAKGFGPVHATPASWRRRSRRRSPWSKRGGVAVVDARILGGYSPATAAAMARGKADRGTLTTTGD